MMCVCGGWNVMPLLRMNCLERMWKLTKTPEWRLESRKKCRQQPSRSLTAEPQQTGQDLSKSTDIWVPGLQPVLKDYFKVTANNLKVYRWPTPPEGQRWNLNSQTHNRSWTKWQYWSISEDSAVVAMTTALCIATRLQVFAFISPESLGESPCDWARRLLVTDSGHASALSLTMGIKHKNGEKWESPVMCFCRCQS